MLELLKFVLDSPANFFGSIFILTYLYALFGSAGLNVVRDVLAHKTAIQNSNVAVKNRELDIEKLRLGLGK